METTELIWALGYQLLPLLVSLKGHLFGQKIVFVLVFLLVLSITFVSLHFCNGFSFSLFVVALHGYNNCVWKKTKPDAGTK